MPWTDEKIRQRLLHVIKDKEPVDWYRLEQIVPIDPRDYPDGTRMMTYIRSLCDEGLVGGSEETAYSITSSGRDALEAMKA